MIYFQDYYGWSLGVLNMLFQGGIYQQMLSHKVSRAFQSQYHSKLSLIYWKLELSLPFLLFTRLSSSKFENYINKLGEKHFTLNRIRILGRKNICIC